MARARRGRSEGSVFFRETDKQWVGSISLGYDGNGKRKRRTVYGASKKEVQEKMRELQGDLGKGIFADAGVLRLADFLKGWLNNTASDKVQATSLAVYERSIRLHIVPVLGGVLLGKLRVDHVEHLYVGPTRILEPLASVW